MDESGLVHGFAEEVGLVERLCCIVRWRGIVAFVGRSGPLALWFCRCSVDPCRVRHGVTVTLLGTSLNSSIVLPRILALSRALTLDAVSDVQC